MIDLTQRAWQKKRMNASRQALVHSGSPPTEYTSLVSSELLFIHESLPSLLSHPRGPFGGMGTVSRPSLVLCVEGFVEEVVQVLDGRIAILWLGSCLLCGLHECLLTS